MNTELKLDSNPKKWTAFQKRYFFAAVVTDLVCVPMAIIAGRTDSRCLAAFILASFVGGGYLLALAAFVKSCVKEK